MRYNIIMANGFSKILEDSGNRVSYIVREITHICRDLPKRPPGSEGERAASRYMADTLTNECGAEAKTETFTEHPASFYGYFYITAAGGILAATLYFVTPILSIIFGALTLLLFVLHFCLYRQVIDFLFPKKESVNVTAIRPCSGEVKRRILFNGHIDAPWEFPLNYHFGGVVFEIPGVMSVLGVTYYIVISILALCGAGWTHTAALIGLVFIPFFILVGCTYNPRVVSDGANDNLSGCMMGIALLRAMEELGVGAEHTEIGVVLTGSEEAGLRGAKAWAKQHADDFKDVPTYILCMDTIHDPKFLMANARDLNGLVKQDRDICELFLKAASDVNVPCSKGWVPPFGGATDSAAFVQGGFRAASITGLNHNLEDYYHTRKDTCDNLNEEGLENCYKALVRFTELAEEGALDQSATT